ncbi:hypothetical protein [Azospirillum sp. TSO22-1]|uniref:hypothetical protein n=1 Tax=Azospirillum sp. TSO22-1 TaxID=716789 RepID=UPI000D605CA4|nr:hypothetical protein [Azospirillum sp. TSO22-1]PWC55944.1 hypothetical protein TSO221_03380 [Azospirillum sp. TSO22-1]
MTRGNRDTEQDKHRAGGPGKAAKSDQKAGNKPAQNQAPGSDRVPGGNPGHEHNAKPTRQSNPEPES